MAACCRKDDSRGGLGRGKAGTIQRGLAGGEAQTPPPPGTSNTCKNDMARTWFRNSTLAKQLQKWAGRGFGYLSIESLIYLDNSAASQLPFLDHPDHFPNFSHAQSQPKFEKSTARSGATLQTRKAVGATWSGGRHRRGQTRPRRHIAARLGPQKRLWHPMAITAFPIIPAPEGLWKLRLPMRLAL